MSVLNYELPAETALLTKAFFNRLRKNHDEDAHRLLVEDILPVAASEARISTHEVPVDPRIARLYGCVAIRLLELLSNDEPKQPYPVTRKAIYGLIFNAWLGTEDETEEQDYLRYITELQPQLIVEQTMLCESLRASFDESWRKCGSLTFRKVVGLCSAVRATTNAMVSNTAGRWLGLRATNAQIALIGGVIQSVPPQVLSDDLFEAIPLIKGSVANAIHVVGMVRSLTQALDASEPRTVEIHDTGHVTITWAIGVELSVERDGGELLANEFLHRQAGKVGQWRAAHHDSTLSIRLKVVNKRPDGGESQYDVVV